MAHRSEVTGRRPPSTSDAGQEEQRNFAPPDGGESEASPGKVCQPHDHRLADPVGLPRGPPDAYTIREFCAQHRISIQLYYKMRAKGLTPAEFRVDTRALISRESAARWRAAMEAATATDRELA